MQIVIVTNSTSYEPRAEMVADFFTNLRHQVTLIESDFIHREKLKGRQDRENHIYIDTMPYKKNMSIRRLYSHYQFARNAYKRVIQLKPDMVYVLIPANSLAKYFGKYKSRYGGKLIFDVIDLWPESLPLNWAKNIGPIYFWKSMRNSNLVKADFVITECNLYRTVLCPYLDNKRTATIYWPKRYEIKLTQFQHAESCLHICYLGSINHIIDIQFIVKLLHLVNRRKHVVVHVIGDGENKEKFLRGLKQSNIETIYHGVIYDEKEKVEIFKVCSFGLNIMKDLVCVGITMKSVDYLSAGMLLINNIHGDIWELIDEYGIGINCSSDNLEIAADMIAKADITDGNRIYAAEIYQKLFSVSSFNSSIKKYLGPILNR